MQQEQTIVARPRKGRGAISNRPGRYEPHDRPAEDDGWDSGWREDDLAVPPLRTSVQIDTSRKVITRNQSPDVPFEQSINPYRGCEHGCVYCFARPTHAFLGLSPGLDFESRLFAKPDAPALLEAELRKPGYKCRHIAMGTNTDPYQPIEREYRITRRILEVLSAFNNPTGIVTKSALVLRDIDILADMAARDLAHVYISVTTLDRELARKMEPRAATPARRIETIRRLADAGIPTGVLVAPIIPAVNDMEIERILETIAEAGAQTAGYVFLRLPLELKDLVTEWLEAHVPDRAGTVLKLIREARGGGMYDPRFGRRMRGSGPYADMIDNRFALACEKLGLNQDRRELDTSKFQRPFQDGKQLGLF